MHQLIVLNIVAKIVNLYKSFEKLDGSFFKKNKVKQLNIHLSHNMAFFPRYLIENENIQPQKGLHL